MAMGMAHIWLFSRIVYAFPYFDKKGFLVFPRWNRVDLFFDLHAMVVYYQFARHDDRLFNGCFFILFSTLWQE